MTVTGIEPDRVLQFPDAEPVRARLDRVAAGLGLMVVQKRSGRLALAAADGSPVTPWREQYPYSERLARGHYSDAKRALQIELLKLQRWVKSSELRLLIVFEGQDAAGKGGTIRRFAENLNPRGLRVVALEKPSAHEQGDGYLRRYLPHMPTPGEIVLFDRSWYNRAGVEHVMGFCDQRDYARFLRDAPAFERDLVASGITLVKFWLSVSRTEQLRRFIDRYADPVKCWKLSPVDLASLDRWDDYARARDVMFRHTDLPDTPWTVIKSNDKKRARLAAMRHVLSRCDYEGKDVAVVGLPDPLLCGPARVAESAAPGPPDSEAAIFGPTILTRIPAPALTAVEAAAVPLAGESRRSAAITRPARSLPVVEPVPALAPMALRADAG
ncbi:MAG: polyphosphate kinase 2 [Streptosporangiaceae bacterium]